MQLYGNMQYTESPLKIAPGEGWVCGVFIWVYGVDGDNYYQKNIIPGNFLNGARQGHIVVPAGCYLLLSEKYNSWQLPTPSRPTRLVPANRSPQD